MADVKVSTKATINAAPPTVFKYLSDLSSHYLWNPHLLNLHPIGKLRLGYEYSAHSIILGVKIKSNNKVTKLLPDKELQIENGTGLVRYKVCYRLKSNSSKTLVSCTITARPNASAFAFTAPVLSMFAKRELQNSLKYLKLAVEQKL